MKIENAEVEWSINSQLIENLTQKNFENFFPVQNEVIPILLKQNAYPCVYPQDICVSAPTGSGKTLSYALPVANILIKEQKRRLRALILLPTRELAVQVFNVFSEIIENTNLKVSLAIGSTSLEQEEADMFRKELSNYSQEPNIDILVCTPSRLIDHLQFTKGFSLSHLRFLILDEADRLLGNAYHGWVRMLLGSVENTRINLFNINSSLSSTRSKKQKIEHQPLSDFFFPEIKLPLQRLLFSATLTDDPSALALLGIYNPHFIHVKNVPTELKGINLNNNSNELNQNIWSEVYNLPATLTERKLITNTQDRLNALLSILLDSFYNSSNSFLYPESSQNVGPCFANGSICIIFVSSVETSHRLSTFLKLVNNQLGLEDSEYLSLIDEIRSRFNIDKSRSKYLFSGRVEEMSRLIKPNERESILQDINNGLVSIIVSSDRMARGFDFPTLNLVINYDIPKHAKTYIHRSGRTARANRPGMCLTLIKNGQQGEFKKMRSSIEVNPAECDVDSLVQTCRMSKDFLASIEPFYEKSLALLPNYLA